MSNEETGKLVRVDSVATKGKKIEISFSNGEKVLCSPDSYSEFRLYEGKEVNRIEFNKTLESIGVPMAKSEPCYSVAEAAKIAAELGFSSEFNFSRFIKQCSGLAPSGLRKGNDRPLYIRK